MPARCTAGRWQHPGREMHLESILMLSKSIGIGMLVLSSVIVSRVPKLLGHLARHAKGSLKMGDDFIATSIKYYILHAPSLSGKTSAVPAVAGELGLFPLLCFKSFRCSGTSPDKGAVSSDGADRFAVNQKEVLELCKRRFFYRPGSDIYGGVAGFFTYGPPGRELRKFPL
ncbi:grs1, partial [Symbiodinium necroappetens]